MSRLVRVYIDESGDDGFKFGAGSSNHLCFAAMILPSDLAEHVGTGVPLLRQELGFPMHREFHYTSESEETKKALVSYLCEWDLQYIALAIDKPKLNRKDFAKSLSLKIRAVEILGRSLAKHIENATLVFDEFGGHKTQTKIRTTIQRSVRILNQTGIKRVAFNRSRSNDLLKLADVLAGCIGQSFSGDEATVHLPFEV